MYRVFHVRVLLFQRELQLSADFEGVFHVLPTFCVMSGIAPKGQSVLTMKSPSTIPSMDNTCT